MKKLILLIVAAIAAASYLVYAYMNGDPMFGTLAKTMDDLPRNERLGSKRNIVVLGVDGREKDDDPGRSDTLFVVMFDPKSKNVSLLSIPRDTRVRIPGHGWDKINHAYAFGGHKLTQQTTEELLGIQVNNYVMVDFSGFESLVDAIGGIDIDVEKDMYYYDDWDDFLIDLPAGQQHLDGKKAIQYVRYRDEEGDIGRIKRQQKFMMAVYEKIASAQILTKMPGLVSEIMKMVKTDLPVSDMLAMGGALHGMMKEQGGLQMATVPGTPEYIDEISYWIPDITDLREQMVDMQGAQMTERYRQGAEKMEAEYKRNLITAQEKEKQKAAEEKIKADEQTEKKIKEDTKEKNKEKEKEAFKICLDKIHKHGLEMKLIDAEYTFDNNKILFYFTADGRIDFRELVKDLAAVFKTRIELRQIGVRDETKILGGIGSCGRPLCCATYMPEFIPVSIKMAKEQNLSLNPSKISGVCGRLMCCLKNEQETYEELNSNLPNVGDYVTTPEKLKGEVSSVNVLRQLVKVIVTLDGDEKEIREYPVAELRFKPKRRNDRMNIDDKELKELEELEKKEGKAHINDD